MLLPITKLSIALKSALSSVASHHEAHHQRKRKEDLLHTLQEQGISVLGPEHRAEAAAVAGRSFAGTPKADPEWGVHWAIGPWLADRSDPRRAELVSFFLAADIVRFGPKAPSTLRFLSRPQPSMPFADKELMLGIKGDKGELQAVVVARKMSGRRMGLMGDLEDAAAITRVLWSHLADFPSAFLDSKLFKHAAWPALRRFKEGMIPLMEDLHERHALEEHWYVHIMAVDPDHQGKGHCGRLMRSVSRIADAEELPCFLFCTKKNRFVYERFGYHVTEETSITDTKSAPEDTFPTFDQMYAMRRSAMSESD